MHYQYEVTATVDRPHGSPWVEASECAESLDDALAIIRQWWEAGEVEPLKAAGSDAHFTIMVRS